MTMKHSMTKQLGAAARRWFVLAAGFFCGVATAQFSTPGSEGGFDIRRDATVAAVEQVMPCVVNIATKNVVPVRDPFEEFYLPFFRRQSAENPYSLGSGVMIDEAGYLLTNDHVVRRADKIAVKFASSLEIYEATVVASDPKSDVALLKLNARPGEKFHAIKLAHEDDLLLGETVLALGNPFGLGGSVTRGILSSKSRSRPKENAKLDVWNWLQTDAPINLGNSGGPLVNLRGELIGLNVAVVNEVEGQPAQGIGFAIPIKQVLAGLSDILVETVRSFWFGARVQAGSSPLVVTLVQPESPAERAGLKMGDAILQLNGKAPKNIIDLADALATQAEKENRLTVQRGLERRELTVQLVPEKNVFNAEMIRRKLGLNLVRVPEGFTISAVETNSPAGTAGLLNGMLVKQVDDQLPPPDLTALAKLIYAKKNGEPVRLDVAAWQQSGAFNVLRQGSVELSPR